MCLHVCVHALPIILILLSYIGVIEGDGSYSCGSYMVYGFLAWHFFPIKGIDHFVF